MAESLPSKIDDSGQILINIKILPDRQELLRSVEILESGFRIRFSFHDRQLSDVLSVDALQAVRSLLKKIYTAGGTFLSSSVRSQFANLLVENYRVMISPTSDGVEHILIKLQKVCGDFLSVFKDTSFIKSSLGPNGNQNVPPLFLELYTKLFDIAQYIDDLRDSPPQSDHNQVINALSTLSDKIKMLRELRSAIGRHLAKPEQDAEDGIVIDVPQPPLPSLHLGTN